jgi:virginiamycin B lyase
VLPIRLTIASLAVTLSFVFAASAQAYVYWGDPNAGTIGRANLDGSDATDAFIQTGGRPGALAVNGSYIYWANESSGTIGRANLDGSGVDPTFITGLSDPNGVAVTSSLIFWSDVGTDKIGNAELDGKNPHPNLIPSDGPPCGVAVDSGSVYWPHLELGPNETRIGRAAFNGTSVKSNLSELGQPYLICGIAVNSANIFWSTTGFANGSEIGRANISNGQGVNPSLIGDADGPCGIAVFGTQLYWANSGNGTIGRANTDGTVVDEAAIHTGGGEICGVAVDSLSSPFTPPPSNSSEPGSGSGGSGSSGSGQSGPPAPTPLAGTLKVKGVKYDKKNGSARVSLTVDEAGTVTVTGKGLVDAKVQAKGAGTVVVTVRAAKPRLAALKRTGKLTAKFVATFTPSGGGATATAGHGLSLRVQVSQAHRLPS